MGFFSAFHRKPANTDTDAAYRIVELIDRYLADLETSRSSASNQFTVTLIARSPVSPAACALKLKAQELGLRHVHARVIFAKPAPAESLGGFVREIRPLLRGELATARIRWARNPGLLDAHEQLTLGASICWSGDAMRRAPQRCNALELAEVNAPGSVRLAVLAFSAMWAASKLLTCNQLEEGRKHWLGSMAPLAMPAHLRARSGVELPGHGEDVTRH